MAAQLPLTLRNNRKRMKNYYRKELVLIGAVVFLALNDSLQAQTQFWADDFENATSPSGGTRTPENNGGTTTAYFKRTTNTGIDLTTISDGNYTNFQGTYFWAGEDHDGPFPGQPEQEILWSGINISGKADIS